MLLAKRSLVIAGLVTAASAAAMPPLSRFLQTHWADIPSAVAPDDHTWGAPEKNLLPQSCGGCHPQQYADWSGSRHSRAMGPGIVGQLLENEASMDSCNDCHAPLLEQRPHPDGAAENKRFLPALRASGLGCASCHVRDGQVHGPPRRAGRPKPSANAPHGGYVEHEAFEDAAFCARCHQFEDSQRRVAGVLLEDTWNEWSQSPWGERNEPCQTCHMPDRRHLWRGIHDPEFTEAALSIQLELGDKRQAVYRVTSERVGHRFPTYVTPRITLTLQSFDVENNVLASESHVLQRRVDIYLREQPFDTRLHPGETATVTLNWKKKEGVSRVRGRILVEPDEFYARFYENHRTDNPEATALIQQAHRETVQNTYTIGERNLTIAR